MGSRAPDTGERIDPSQATSAEDRVSFARHEFAYQEATKYVRGGRVLDLGCGKGYGSSILLETAKEVIGLDVDADAIGGPGSEGFMPVVGDGLGLPFEEETFDAVVAFQVVEHVDDDEGFLHELGRVVKAGGLVLLTTPNRRFRLQDGQRPWNRHHVREYSGAEYKRLLGSSFEASEVWAVDVRDPWRSVEMGRLRRLSRLGRLDAFRLRERVPASWARAIGRLGGSSGSKDLEAVGADIAFLSEQIESGFDFFSVSHVGLP